MLETQGESARVISVFGMSAGAGVTTLTLSLAQEMAAQAEPVVLVDANVSDPNIHKKLGFNLKPGVAEVLESPDGVSQALRSLHSDHLKVLTCGEWADLNSASMRWAGLFDRLRGIGRPILVDAGVGSAPNSTAIATASDSVVLVVEAGASRWEQVDSFAHRMKSLGVPVLGVIINKRRFPIPEFIYRHL